MPRLFLVRCVWRFLCIGSTGLSIAQAQVDEATEEEEISE